MPNFSSVTFMVAPFIHCQAVHAKHARKGAAVIGMQHQGPGDMGLGPERLLDQHCRQVAACGGWVFHPARRVDRGTFSRRDHRPGLSRQNSRVIAEYVIGPVSVDRLDGSLDCGEQAGQLRAIMALARGQIMR